MQKIKNVDGCNQGFSCKKLAKFLSRFRQERLESHQQPNKFDHVKYEEHDMTSYKQSLYKKWRIEDTNWSIYEQTNN